MGKIGRNECCPCGSGVKYKKCCLGVSAIDENVYPKFPSIKRYPQENIKAPIKEFEHDIVDKTFFSLERKILDYINQNCPDYINDAKSHMSTLLYRLNFKGRTKGSGDDLIDAYTSQFIIPWALYNWVPDLFDQFEKNGNEISAKDNTIALAFTKNKHTQLDDAETKLLKLLNESYFCFYQVERIDDNNTLLLTNLLFDERHRICDSKMASALQVDDIILARIICYEGCELIYGGWPMVIPKWYFERIEDFKNDTILLNNKQPLNGYLFRTRFEFDILDYLSLIIANMVEHETYHSQAQ